MANPVLDTGNIKQVILVDENGVQVSVAGSDPSITTFGAVQAQRSVLYDQNGNPLAWTNDNLAPFQVSVAATATLIVAARSGRAKVTIENSGTTAFYVGPTNTVSTTTGFLIPGVAGASLTIEYTGALYGITAAGTAGVTGYEIY